MNHPASQCNNFLEELVKISDAVLSSQSSSEGPDSHIMQEDASMYQLEDDDDMVSLTGPEECLPSTGWFSDSARVSKSKYHVEVFPNASQVYGQGDTFMDLFDADVYAEKRKDNIYYPFMSRHEWEIASFLLRLSLSMSAIDKFLELELVSFCLCEAKVKTHILQIRHLHLSFRTAKELRSRAEMLPAGPSWKCTPWTTTYPTKVPLKLFHRDSLDCLQSILHSPLMKDSIHLTPLRVFKTAEKVMRVYGQWMTGHVAWDMQVR